MFAKVSVELSAARRYIAYVAGERVELVACIDGHVARLGEARWDGTALAAPGVRLRPDAAAALTRAIRRAAAARAVS